jgi:hypothetical protein
MKILSFVEDIYGILLELEKPIFNKPFDKDTFQALSLDKYHNVEITLRCRTGREESKLLKYMTLSVHAETFGGVEHITMETQIRRFESFTETALEAGAMAAGRQLFKALRRYYLENPEQPIVVHDFMNRQRTSKVLSVELGKAIGKMRKSDEEIVRIRFEEGCKNLKVASGFGIYKSWKLEPLQTPAEVA